ncbi:GTPase Obg [Seminavis robusta]|uniref:GTPase Obg n=1 Tax=Seminavis robusta TaxID=568900 RepID=A0A9N8DCP9_9STRA|nr:GTPase Obg [Seminavis robusta]|eukprot:Sro83_g044300.1 GTPase Obg (592) ;mRNA; f:42924-44803
MTTSGCYRPSLARLAGPLLLLVLIHASSAFSPPQRSAHHAVGLHMATRETAPPSWYDTGSTPPDPTPTAPQQNQYGQRDDPEWKFFDTARMHVSGGDGGTGCVAFRREKGEPRGGPSGGSGGRGGSIYLVCDEGLNTLAPIRNRVHVRAAKGKNGLGKSKDGKKGKHVLVRVPPGTVVRDLKTNRLAGELRDHGQKFLVAKGGRGGRGNQAFMTNRMTSPKLAERGEPGVKRWLAVELRLVADVGFLGKPNAGKSTLLAAASAAKPKIANYPFTTVVPNLGVCDLGEEGAGLVLCDIPGLIEGAAGGAGLGPAFLRHVQRCKVLLHVVDATSETPIEDFHTINKELQLYDTFLAQKKQVVVLNKNDCIDEERQEELMEALKQAAGHTRILSISAVTTKGVKELMGRLKKFVSAQPEADLPPPPEIDLSKAGLDYDCDDFEIISDPSYPGQWRVSGSYIEHIAQMTHWDYPQAVERFGRQLEALGISAELQTRGAEDGDLVMIDKFDFEFSPGLTNVYLPPELLEAEAARDGNDKDDEEEERPWRPFSKGGFLDEDVDEFVGFGELEDWEMLEDEDFDEEDFVYSDEEIWTA